MEQGLAASTQQVYKLGMKRFHDFCSCYNVCIPFPLSEKLLRYCAVYLAECKLTLWTIDTYLSAVCSMHITLGFLDPRDSSSLPVLQRVQAGIKRVQANKHSPMTWIEFHITPAMLNQLRVYWERLVVWAASTSCFAGFFCSGELFPPSENQLT